MSSRIPSKVEYSRATKELILHYGPESHRLSSEYLRVYSPSAEVRGHGVGNEKLQTGKRDVGITRIETVGNYALKLVFDDGHDSGLYDWGYLETLATEQHERWHAYLDKLKAANATREPPFFKSHGNS